MQYAVAIAGVISYGLMFFLLPETSHPNSRGVDKLPNSGWKWAWLNPFRCLWLLRSPNLLTLVGYQDSRLDLDLTLNSYTDFYIVHCNYC